jgi:hypothetical protein
MYWLIAHLLNAKTLIMLIARGALSIVPEFLTDSFTYEKNLKAEIVTFSSFLRYAARILGNIAR